MDNLTHTLTGIALAQAGLKRKTKFAMLALIIGSNLPDIDIVTSARGSVDYLSYHRGLTHSLPGLTALAAILAAVIYVCGRNARKRSLPLNVKWLFMVCWIATLCHVLMDYTNAYGIRPFLPFSGRWYAWDIMPIVGPYLLLFLILGLGVPVIFRLVSEEVGAAKGSPCAARNGAMFCLCALLATWGIRDLSHRRVLGMLESHTYGEENPRRLGAFPSALSPFKWTGVVETGSSYYILDASALADDVALEGAEVLRKPGPSPALAAARKTRAARIFLNFARFPWAVVYGTEDGFQVYIRDLRFAYPGSRQWGFVVEVDLDKSLRVRKQSFRFSLPKPFD